MLNHTSRPPHTLTRAKLHHPWTQITPLPHAIVWFSPPWKLECAVESFCLLFSQVFFASHSISFSKVASRLFAQQCDVLCFDSLMNTVFELYVRELQLKNTDQMCHLYNSWHLSNSRAITNQQILRGKRADTTQPKELHKHAGYVLENLPC